MSRTCEVVQVSAKTVVDFYHFIHEVVGSGVIVQIDESLFVHKSKYNKGRRAQAEQWVFGLADTSTRPATVLVPQRNTATLLPIIQ